MCLRAENLRFTLYKPDGAIPTSGVAPEGTGNFFPIYNLVAALPRKRKNMSHTQSQKKFRNPLSNDC